MHRRTLFIAVLALGLLAVPALAQDQINVTEILLGSELEEGVVTSPATSFARGSTPLYCMVRLENPSRAAGAITIGFERAEGEPAANPGGRRLEIPARPRYRTVARASLNRPAGTWRCVVRAEDGSVLTHADFTVTE